MPFIQGKHDGRAAITRVAIIDAARYREYKQFRQIAIKGAKPYSALIDTGATSTMITSRVVQELNLQPVGKLPYHGLDGLTDKIGYLFHLAFYDSSESFLPIFDDGDQHITSADNNRTIHVCTKPVIGAELETLPSFDVLLGMDILTTGDFNMDRRGYFKFVFS
jgi:hypothetical protein